MATYKVPGDYPTIQEAIDAASLSIEQENTIDIGVAFEYYPHIEIGGAFSETKRLTIRPDPEVGGLKRVAIANRSLNHPIVKIAPDGNFPSFITLQDLDIVRDVTNTEDIIQIFDSYKITIERCRIGSIWPSTGVSGKSNLRIKDTLELVVRNTIFFSYQLGTLDFGIYIDFYENPENPPLSILLYNNVVSDYKQHGIHAITGGGDESLLLLRNNVVVNHYTASDPKAFWSVIDRTTKVVTSHNAAFTGAEEDVEVAAGEKISGEGNTDFLRRTRAQIRQSFVEYRWNREEENQNVDFFRLIRGGSLHNESTDVGINVYNHSPNDRDIAVTDDIEKDVRPAGIPSHTDRGADQIRVDDNFLSLDSLRLSRSTLPGGKESIGKIVLNEMVPEGGWKIKVISTNPAATVPASVLIPAGSAFQTFTINTKPVRSVKRGKVIATCQGVTKSRLLTVKPIGVASVKLSSSTASGGKEITGLVSLEHEAAPNDIKVTLKSNSTRVIVPGLLTIRRDMLNGHFTVRVKPVKAITSVIITATANGISKKVTLRIKP